MKLHPIEEYQSNLFLKRVLEKPDDPAQVRLIYRHRSVHILVLTDVSFKGSKKVSSPLTCPFDIFFRCVFRTAGALVLQVTYGYKFVELSSIEASIYTDTWLPAS